MPTRSPACRCAAARATAVLTVRSRLLPGPSAPPSVSCGPDQVATSASRSPRVSSSSTTCPSASTVARRTYSRSCPPTWPRRAVARQSTCRSRSPGRNSSTACRSGPSPERRVRCRPTTEVACGGSGPAAAGRTAGTTSTSRTAPAVGPTASMPSWATHRASGRATVRRPQVGATVSATSARGRRPGTTPTVPWGVRTTTSSAPAAAGAAVTSTVTGSGSPTEAVDADRASAGTAARPGSAREASAHDSARGTASAATSGEPSARPATRPPTPRPSARRKAAVGSQGAGPVLTRGTPAASSGQGSCAGRRPPPRRRSPSRSRSARPG